MGGHKQTVPFKLLEQDMTLHKQATAWRNISNRNLVRNRKLIIYCLLKAEQAGEQLAEFIPALQRLAQPDSKQKKGKGRAACLMTKVLGVIQAEYPTYLVSEPKKFESDVLKWH